MNSWQEKKLGDFLTQKKREVIINPNAEYSLVTISNKGIIRLREKKRGAEIAAKKAYLAKAGDFIYSRLAAHTGAFGIVGEELDNALVTGEMPCFEIDKRQALPDILTNMLNTPGVIWQLKQFTKGMGRVRIKEQMMLSLSLLLPDISEQKKISKNIQAFKHRLAQLGDEFLKQRGLLAVLRWRVLHEAIESRLRADWRKGASRNYESAEVLLKRISQEKERLIKAGELKKQKALPPVADNEKPFALPQGWAWCRLGDLAQKIVTGSSPRWQGINYVDKNEGVLFITSKNVGIREMLFHHITYLESKFNDIQPRSILQKGDILTNLVGASIARTALYCLDEAANINQAVALIRVFDCSLNKDYIVLYMNCDMGIKYLLDSGFSHEREYVGLADIKNMPIPLPPLAEQRAIVAKAEKLLALRDSMEEQIRNNEALAKRLMQAALKEAFTPPKN